MTRAPLVAIDARMATDGGIGTYLQALVPRIAALKPDWRFTVLGDARELEGLGWTRAPNVAIRELGARIFSVREQVEIPLRTPAGCDLFWAPHYNAPLRCRARRLVVTIHDVNHVALPGLMGAAHRRWYARWMLRRVLRCAQHVLFDTEFTRGEAARLLGGAGRSSVVHLAVDETWAAAPRAFPRRPLNEPYFLYVGNFKRHKNLPVLLNAFARVARELPHRLVLIGRREGLRADPAVERELERLGSRALALGEVSRDIVREYVAHAEALVTASLYEGFGLPPLEAMAAGCPAIVSRAGSLPEVCGDAALYCDPRDEQSVAARMVELACDPALRSQLVARGRARAASFSWDRAAAQTAAALESAL